MLRFSLDWNCVIEVEEGRSQSSHVLALVDAHRRQRVNVALLAASASENTGSRVFPGSARAFLSRVERIGWHDLPIVLVPAIISLTFLDYSYIVNEEEFPKQFDGVWSAMFPNFRRDPREHLAAGTALNDASIQSPTLCKWRNAWCDVMSAISHIDSQRDVFVTNNTRDFQRNATALAAFGMGRIETPENAAALLN
ncbi:MAG: hypothetical protein ACK4GO_04540 [Gemmobacter sp.]